MKFNFSLRKIFTSKKPKQPVLEKKNSLINSCSSFESRNSLVDFLLGKNEYKLAAYQAVEYFYKCAPLFDGVDRLAQAISSIKPMVYDTKNKEYITDHPILGLLKKPSFNTSFGDFIYQYASFMILTGDNYIFVNSLGDNSEPRQMFIRPPQSVSMNLGGDGFVNSYYVNLNSVSAVYERQIDMDQGYKYINTSNGVTSQLFHSKTFNPTTQGFAIKGCSVLNSIYYEIEQYISTGIHNLSLLKRGANLSGIFTSESRMADDDYMRLKAQIDEYFCGDNNAGRPFLAENGLEFQSTQQTNKDMDFLSLKEIVTSTIYNILRIPLPMISKDVMTMANLSASKVNFYDNGVLPWVDRIYDDLTNALMPYYKDSENLVIAYNINDIPALETRKIENLVQLKEAGALTLNEMRGQLNYEAAIDGDDFYQPSSNVIYASAAQSD